MTDRLGDFARNYWPVVAGLIAAAVAWGSLSFQNTANGDQLRLMSTKLDRIAEGFASVQTTALYNSADITELRKRVHDLETARR